MHFGKADAQPQLSNIVYRRSIGSDAYIWLGGIPALFEELQVAGAEFVEGPINEYRDHDSRLQRLSNRFWRVIRQFPP
ncbi:hypothetical protein BH20ACI2_BH20ACI2_22800 [soil metagenome]